MGVTCECLQAFAAELCNVHEAGVRTVSTGEKEEGVGGRKWEAHTKASIYNNKRLGSLGARCTYLQGTE